MQHHITKPGPLLDENGVLLQKGYSTQSVLTYDRSAIKAKPWQIKEWDFYQISNEKYCLQMVIGHVSYAGDVSITLFEFDTGKKYNVSKMLTLPFNSLQMRASAESGDLKYIHVDIQMSFEIKDNQRRSRSTA